MTKQETLNKLYKLYNKVATPQGVQKYTLAVVNALWFVILDIKVENKAEFVQDKLFDILKDDFNIKIKGIGWILDLKNN